MVTYPQAKRGLVRNTLVQPSVYQILIGYTSLEPPGAFLHITARFRLTDDPISNLPQVF